MWKTVTSPASFDSKKLVYKTLKQNGIKQESRNGTSRYDFTKGEYQREVSSLRVAW